MAPNFAISTHLYSPNASLSANLLYRLLRPHLRYAGLAWVFFDLWPFLASFSPFVRAFSGVDFPSLDNLAWRVSGSPEHHMCHCCSVSVPYFPFGFVVAGHRSAAGPARRAYWVPSIRSRCSFVGSLLPLEFPSFSGRVSKFSIKYHSQIQKFHFLIPLTAYLFTRSSRVNRLR